MAERPARLVAVVVEEGVAPLPDPPGLAGLEEAEAVVRQAPVHARLWGGVGCPTDRHRQTGGGGQGRREFDLVRWTTSFWKSVWFEKWVDCGWARSSPTTTSHIHNIKDRRIATHTHT